MSFPISRTQVHRLCFLFLAACLFTACNKTVPGDDNSGPYNFDAVLHTADMKDYFSGGRGLLKFRQNPDTARIIDLNTYLEGLQPNHDYILQRAANPITDADCSSTAWLTLGLGLTPKSIHTDGKGNGHEVLYRDVTAIARNTTFRIHFQILDASTMATVLVSDCEQYTVR